MSSSIFLEIGYDYIDLAFVDPAYPADCLRRLHYGSARVRCRATPRVVVSKRSPRASWPQPRPSRAARQGHPETQRVRGSGPELRPEASRGCGIHLHESRNQCHGAGNDENVQREGAGSCRQYVSVLPEGNGDLS